MPPETLPSWAFSTTAYSDRRSDRSKRSPNVAIHLHARKPSQAPRSPRALGYSHSNRTTTRVYLWYLHWGLRYSNCHACMRWCCDVYRRGRLLEYEQWLDEYFTQVCQALWRKDHTSFQAEEYFVIFFLAIAESFRFCCYQKISRPPSDLTRARSDLSVHIRGSLTITKHLTNRQDVDVSKKFGQIWLYAQDLLALWGIYAKPEEIVELAFLYRQQISKVEIDYRTSTDAIFRAQAVKATTDTASAFGNFVISLSKILLEDLIVSNRVDSLRRAAMHEIKEYLQFSERALEFWNEVTASHASRDRCYEILQLVASKIILQIAKDPSFSTSSSEGFALAMELLSIAQSFHDESLFRIYDDIERQAALRIWDERAAIIYVGIASLVVPPPEAFHRTSKC